MQDVYKRQENIFENSDFVYMLNQAGGDRQILAKQLWISTHQLSYVTHSGAVSYTHLDVYKRQILKASLIISAIQS